MKQMPKHQARDLVQIASVSLECLSVYSYMHPKMSKLESDKNAVVERAAGLVGLCFGIWIRSRDP